MMAAQQGLTQRMEDLAYQRRVELRNQALERSVSARQNIQNTFQGALAMVPGMTGGISKMGGGKPQGQWGFDPLSATSPGVGNVYPGAYDAQYIPRNTVDRMSVRTPYQQF
jgi:hypothetical protein